VRSETKDVRFHLSLFTLNPTFVIFIKTKPVAMKKFFLIACTVMTVSALQAQDSLTIYTPNTGKKENSQLRFSPVYKFKEIPPVIARRDTFIQTMPVVGHIKQPVYVFNNGNGFDVYQSPLDQMLIAEPDSAFHSNMPVKRYGKAEDK
jgi:hypothetical protein